VKATQKNFASTAAKAVREARIFYFCGPDESGSSDAAATIARLLGEAEKIELSGSELRKDPARLADEARSVSLFGDKRVIQVRCAGDEVHDAVEALVASPVAGWPVLIVAGGATDKSRVAKLLADRPDALVAMFYAPDVRSVAQVVRTMADGLGVRLNDDLAERIARNAALDARMARSEVEKLALYLDASPQAPRTADVQALDAIGAVNEDDGLMPLVNVALSGESGRLAGELARMRELGLNPVGILLMAERRAAQLAQLSGKLDKRGDINALLEQERVFFRDKADIANQMRRWRGRKLERLLVKLADMHRALLADSRNAELLLVQGFVEIARAAAR
jgi:DNA polymerase-3 subunit delta